MPLPSRLRNNSFRSLIAEALVPQPLKVDVRDMLCAQALAMVARVAGRGVSGEALEVAFNTEDVLRDLFAWARDRGYAVVTVNAETLRVLLR
jgi:TusA-related sulfurtransferase